MRDSVFICQFRMRTTCPIYRVHAFHYSSMECRIAPIGHVFDQAMFDRIEMHIIHMRAEIAFITDEVLPISPLPDASFSTPLSHQGAALAVGYPFREQKLDKA
jgi:hypothetical protein